MDTGVRNCTGQHTKCTGTIYPRDEVPTKLFETPNGKYYAQCSDCRLYNRQKTNKSYDKKKILAKIEKEIANSIDTEYSFCPYSGHTTIVKSFHPQNLVPIDFFRKEEGNTKSEFFDKCSDCREYLRKTRARFENNRLIEAHEMELYMCRSCSKLIKTDERALNLDDTLSSDCVPCKTKKYIRDFNRLQVSNTIKHELIEKYECSCYECKCLYFKPKDDSLIVQKILTYEKFGERYALIDNEELLVKDIIKLYYKELEFRIIEFDHLPENDQRERGLLSPNEKFIPKKSCVSDQGSEASIRLESLKCQHLCILCHTIKTIEREKGESTKTGITKSKYNYVSKCKEKGCSSCGYINSNLVRFFDMDHIDINTKITEVGKMCREPFYSLDDVINECLKCRVLCRHCHKIHTDKQRKDGMFLPNKI